MKHKVFISSATPEVFAFIESCQHELAKKDVKQLFGNVVTAILIEELSENDAATVKDWH